MRFTFFVFDTKYFFGQIIRLKYSHHKFLQQINGSNFDISMYNAMKLISPFFRFLVNEWP